MAAKKSVLAQTLAYPGESYAELKKVHRPTRQETIQMTIGVLFMVVVVSLFLGTIDLGLGWMMHWTMENFLAQ